MNKNQADVVGQLTQKGPLWGLLGLGLITLQTRKTNSPKTVRFVLAIAVFSTLGMSAANQLRTLWPVKENVLVDTPKKAPAETLKALKDRTATN